MFIGLCGSAYAGKVTIAKYLNEVHDFTPILLTLNPSTTSESAHPIVPSSLTFTTVEALLDHVTKYWRSHFVLADIPSEAILEQLSRRPFFLLVSVDAPLTVRYRRFQQDRLLFSRFLFRWSPAPSQTTPLTTPSTLEDFALLSDTHLYHPTHGQLPLMSRAVVRILNTSSDLSALYATLDRINLLDPNRLRPSWDSYFMSLASLAAHRSNCMKRRVGCVVVRDKRVISTGYNGTPRGLVNCGEGGCGRCNAGEGSGHGLATCLCLHAEENALLEAGRERLREGAVLYCDTCPCLTCSIKIVQVGISEVVYSQEYSMDEKTKMVLKEGGVRLRQFVP
ncbi:hypothetical protein OQA88_1926 [Cercophora sp. LCS_1]